MKSFSTALIVCAAMLSSACSTVYYGTMEKVGIHKRDILVDRVEDTRDSQEEAQEQFKSALEKFGSVVKIEDSNLKSYYESLNDEYENSKEAAEEVSDRINAVEDVAEDLFDEWSDEIETFSNPEFKRSSKAQLRDTQSRYKTMLASMRKAESSMKPVLKTFHDNVLFLKHNLNAQAIGSLKSEFGALKSNIDQLINRMNQSIEQSDEFIAEMRKQSA
ncbi:MAG TPA: DUF2959 domain-containing protein [Gammaproteobacteria bacterium]|jgi:ElaB/YqjD/DUF883 family membrane-anchored ribosome-binding protein|nr:DUF2959 domain-containing protein [Gammaproteobacteria bacterium]